VATKTFGSYFEMRALTGTMRSCSGSCGALRRSAYLTDDEPPELAFYCPDCRDREFGDV